MFYASARAGSDRPRHFIWRRLGSARLALSISTMSIFQICSGKFSTEQRILAVANWNPRGTDCATPIRTSRLNCMNAAFPVRTRPNLLHVTTWSSTAPIISRHDIYQTTFAYLGGPCYRCLFPEPPAPGTIPNCAEAGVLGVLPGIIGMVQAIEAIKLILGVGEPLIGRLLHFEALKMKFRELKLRRDPKCPVCGDAPTITAPIDYEQFCGIAADVPAMSVHDLKRKRDGRESIQLIDVREPFEFEIAQIDGAKLIPIGHIADRLHELKQNGQTVVHCHTGMRSAQAVQMLRQSGFTNVYNLEGGIDAWANEIDPAVQKY